MGAIKSHKTKIDKTGAWDGPKAVADAPNEAATLKYMHAYVDEKGDPDKKASYKFPHHETGTDTAAVIKGVNNALSRLPQAKIPAGDRAGVEAHLRKHRKDAGLEEALGEAEIAEVVKFFKEMNDLKADEAEALQEEIAAQETSNLGNWLEARIHLSFTEVADMMFGEGYVTREERITLSGAIGEALNAFRAKIEADAGHLYQRRPFEGPPEGQVVEHVAKWDGAVWAAIGEIKETGAEPGNVELREAALGGDFTPLMEKAVRRDGTIPIKIIQPGWGSSGYYPAEVLERDGPQVFLGGMHMYWDHPTMTEEVERPERTLRDLAAVLVTDASWQEAGPKGPGLYADAKVFNEFAQPIDDLAEHIGVSIRALGKAQNGTAEGKNGPIITELTAGKSVDFVTAPGAGGEIITLFEAARTQPTAGGRPAANADKPATSTGDVATNLEEVEMEELQKLQETVATLQNTADEAKAENARLAEALALRDAKDLVGAALAKIELPEATKKRLVEGLPKRATLKEGKLDSEAFEKVIEEAVKEEVAYLTETLGLGNIKGLGGSGDPEEELDESKVEEELGKSFEAMGLSEKKAKVAAKGR